MKITEDIIYAGVNDHQIDLFEGQYEVPLGMAYNSYVIMDEKIAVTDTVDSHFVAEWLQNVKEIADGREPSYLIVHHMEPDHSAGVRMFLEAYPQAVLVMSQPAWNMFMQFFPECAGAEKLIVKEGSELSLGKHELVFYTAAMVHWPEVIISYDKKDKVLFSADAFGKFGANDVEDPEGWDCEARRYYFGIVGKYGMQVQNVLKKLANLDVEHICSLHGPVLNEDLGHYIGLYQTWSSYEPEDDGVFIAYASVYGNTEKAAHLLKQKLEERGMTNIKIADLAREDFYENIENAFRYKRLVLASVTYDTDCFPVMRKLIEQLVHRNYQKRTVGLIENGTWGPMAAKVMKGLLEPCKELNILEPVVTIRSTLNEASTAKLDELADALLK